MLRKIQFVALCTLFAFNVGCQEPAKEKIPAEEITPGIAFLKDCKKWSEKYSGALQGLDAKRRDSAGNLCFSEYYGSAMPYEIVFVYKASVEQRRQMPNDSINNNFLHGCDSLFADFDCFAFVHPMINPDSLSDIHKDNDIYPGQVKVYKRIKDDQWSFVRETKVNSLRELSDLKFRTIYGL